MFCILLNIIMYNLLYLYNLLECHIFSLSNYLLINKACCMYQVWDMPQAGVLIQASWPGCFFIQLLRNRYICRTYFQWFSWDSKEFGEKNLPKIIFSFRMKYLNNFLSMKQFILMQNYYFTSKWLFQRHMVVYYTSPW